MYIFILLYYICVYYAITSYNNEHTELAGIRFRRLKNDMQVATKQHSFQSKTTEEAKTKLHTIYKVTSQIESIENHWFPSPDGQL